MRAAKLIASVWTLVVGVASAEPLKVVLSAARTTYAISDAATFQVALVNASDERISIYRILQWGYAAGFVLHVFDEKGNRVNLLRYDDYVPIPSTLSKSDSYVILEPDHLLGTLRTDKVSDWGVKPGLYTIEVEYRSPVPGKYHKEAQFWTERRACCARTPSPCIFCRDSAWPGASLKQRCFPITVVKRRFMPLTTESAERTLPRLFR